ncbi:MAG TPA: LysR family transcriptional regulator [Polyangia bacterium]|jgi:DNA-binding transcriptional LysR family regulator
MDPALIPALHDALVVAQTGSVGEAARRLHKTASAVSQQLRRIERRFGVALFERAGRGLRPSPAGETVLGSLTRLFDEASSLEGLLDELATERVTTLRVAASDYLGEALLLPVLRRLAADATPLRFDITTTNSVEAARLLADGLVDVAMVSSHRPAGPDATVLCRQRFFWIAPRRGPRDRRPQPLRARLAREPLLRLGAGSQGRRLLDEMLARLRLQPPSTIDVPSVSLVLSYARQGLGVSLVPELALARGDRRRLVIEAADVAPMDVHLVCRPTLKRTRAVARFLDGLAEEARRAAAAQP